MTKHKKDIPGSEALLLSLIAEGVDTIFGYPGGTIMPVYDALMDYDDQIHHILTRHEQGAIHAAQGYSRASGKAGVCMATSGPGATNLITGIADAMIDSTPVVCITAQVTSNLLGSDAFQEADMINMTAPITKWNYQITNPDEIAPAIAKAFYIATTGRPGPVVIEIAKDAQVEKTDFVYSPCNCIRSYDPIPKTSEESIEQAIQMLLASEKPLILAGQGIKISGAEKTLVEFAEKWNIPVASTLMGMSAMPSDHPLQIGMLGMHGNLAGNMMTQEADLIIAAGMRFSDRVTGKVSAYAPHAKIIHIDIDPVEFNKIINPAIAIHADLKLALEKMIPAAVYKPREEWAATAAKHYKQECKMVIDHDLEPQRDAISMAEVVAAVSAESKGEAVVVTDVGQHQMIAARYSRYKNTRSLITSGGLGTMGYGLPAAIGAKLAVPEKEVVSFSGDGGFQMTMQELGTIMQWNIGVKIVVLNNHFLGMVRQWQELFYDKRYASTPMVNPDFVEIASAYKIPSCRVTSREELKDAIHQMFTTPGAFLLEVQVAAEDNVFPMIPAGASINDLIFNAE